MRQLLGLLIGVGVAGAGCTKTVNECNSDSDCTDVAYPFCDVAGQYGPSGGNKNVCTIIPPDCPVDRCGCSPGATTCADDQLQVCNTDGKGTTATSCALGCATSADRCLTFAPLNGLGSALVASATKPAVTLPASVKIDTTTGTVTDMSGGLAVPFESIVITQAGAPDIRAYIASSIDISAALVTGSKSLALVASGEIAIHGLIDASANGLTAGPGGMETGPCLGSVNTTGGGGGNATDGAAGASLAAVGPKVPGGPGGTAVTLFEPLFGGCRGGSAVAAQGGAGGGALQIVSGVRITNDASMMLDLGGGGSTTDANGGGAGGTAILEAPVVAINGAILANGAAGSACGVYAADGTRTLDAAAGAACGTGAQAKVGGAGGTRTMLPTVGFSAVGDGTEGGGGAVGRVLVRTIDGSYSAGASSLISAALLTEQLPTQ